MTALEKGLFNRTELLLGSEAVERFGRLRVIIVGVGGVGSWCADALVRSGVGHLTIVDSDRVCITNCNRQLMATSKTIGQVKVEALCNHLLEVNPKADITVLQKIYSEENAAEFQLDTYDVIIDAIDSLKDKAALILHATQIVKQNPGCLFLSSMGAALRMNPTKIRVAEFWKIQGDPLARALRNKFKRQKSFPAVKFQCVYSEETPLLNRGTAHTCGTAACMCPKAKLLSGTRGEADAVYDAPGDQRLAEHEWCTQKAQINGSMAHITAIFGMTLAGLVLQYTDSIGT